MVRENKRSVLLERLVHNSAREINGEHDGDLFVGIVGAVERRGLDEQPSVVPRAVGQLLGVEALD